MKFSIISAIWFFLLVLKYDLVLAKVDNLNQFNAVKNWSIGGGGSLSKDGLHILGHLSQSLSHKYHISMNELIDIRPYPSKVRVREGANYYHQFKEFRWALGLGFSKDIFLGNGDKTDITQEILAQ